MLEKIWSIFFLVVCSVTDIRERKINSWFCIGNIIVMIFAHIICHNDNMWDIAGGMLLAGIFFVISKVSKEAIGMGDVIVIMTIGIVCGVIYVMEMLFWASVVCLIFSCGGIALRKLHLKSKLPFVPFILAGDIIFMLTEINMIF